MQPVATEIVAADGVSLTGHWWPATTAFVHGSVVINGATGVLARYYHRYAAFLAAHGFHVLTYDYRGIGLSRPAKLSGQKYGWRQWGELDVDAALRHAIDEGGMLPVLMVGHSIGGFLPGYAESGAKIHRMLTVGAQYAYWRDYHAAQKLELVFRWHVAMPGITTLWGYFPGRRLGWLEDLPPGVVHSWSFGKRRFELRLKPSDRQKTLARFAAVTAPILAVSVSDDPFATKPAMTRSLDYYSGAEAIKVMLEPADLAVEKVGHFDLFHDRHASGFWLDTLLWLRDGINPWPGRCFA
ncbi:alpha/beta hydrolase family protein [Rhizobium terrae]|uniref:alpha/beta hydrolase family protein n=1 Tax=Rhizobium terrae TaxID=2171756 RepID=UPI000E3B5F04|nr:alpha/beta fold hydrolase [Rhizobium terrae]